MTDTDPTQTELTKALQLARSVLVVTGAGVSMASGIPTFRGTDEHAVWASDVTELGTFRYFKRDPAGSWRWYLSRFGVLDGKLPNPAHLAIVALEDWCTSAGKDFLLVTQNVDGLHRVAGSRQVVEVHGAARFVRCATTGCRNGAPKGSIERADVEIDAFLNDPVEQNVPTCVICGNYIRQHVLWFDEAYDGHRDYQIIRVLRAAKRASVVLFVGTSFSVGITEMILDRSLAKNATVFSVDPAGQPTRRQMQVIVDTAESALPMLVASLGQSGSG